RTFDRIGRFGAVIRSSDAHGHRAEQKDCRQLLDHKGHHSTYNTQPEARRLQQNVTVCREACLINERRRLRWRRIMRATVTIICILAAAGLAVWLALERRASVKLERENHGLRQRLSQMDKLAAENQRLSNLVAEA